MFEWSRFAAAVAEGTAPPLDAVAALAELSDDAVLGMDQDESVAVIEIAQAALAALAAVQALGVEAFARREQERLDRQRADNIARHQSTLNFTHAHEIVPAMLASIFHVAPRTMANILGETQLLINELPTTFALARAGRLESSRARAVANEAQLVDPDLRRAYEDELYGPDNGRTPRPRVKTIVEMTYGALSRKAARAAVRVDPESAKERAVNALRERTVSLRPGGVPGVTSWWAVQPADTSVQAWAAIEALAAEYAAGNPGLTIAQARADAMMNLILGQATVTTTVDLVIPAPTGTATPDDVDLSDPPTGPGDSPTGPGDSPTGPGEPPLSPDDTARDEALTHAGEATGQPDRLATVIRLAFCDLGARLGATDCAVGVTHRQAGIILTDQLNTLLADPDTLFRLHSFDPDTGVLNRHDPKTYRPGAQLARAVRARDGTCRFPGCTTPAQRCQLDHVTPFPRGQTIIENLASLCTSHHGFKHHAGWRLSITPDGICTWNSPLDRSYTTHPQDHRDLAA